MSYTYVQPRHELPDEWAVRIRTGVAGRDDIRAVYWLTTLYDTGDAHPGSILRLRG
jgi:hypothetical protein